MVICLCWLSPGSATNNKLIHPPMAWSITQSVIGWPWRLGTLYTPEYFTYVTDAFLSTLQIRCIIYIQPPFFPKLWTSGAFWWKSVLTYHSRMGKNNPAVNEMRVICEREGMSCKVQRPGNPSSERWRIQGRVDCMTLLVSLHGNRKPIHYRLFQQICSLTLKYQNVPLQQQRNNISIFQQSIK